MGAQAQRVPEGKQEAKPKGIVSSLFKKFSANPVSDSVPAGISKRAVMGGQKSRLAMFFGKKNGA